MPLQLPDLDDRSYKDLVAEALSMIPNYASEEWTNYNPSDPGITLIEMFAYLSEMLIYRLNQITDDNLRVFLQLLNGPDWQPEQDLKIEIRLAVNQLRECYRAVTREDYETLSTDGFNKWLDTQEFKDWFKEWKQQTQSTELSLQPIKRAYCVLERNLEWNLEEESKKDAPGHVSVIILPALPEPVLPASPADDSVSEPQPTEAQRAVLWHYLNQRRILATHHHVVGPIYVPVSAEIVVARRSDIDDETLKTLKGKIVKAIQQFLSPLPVAQQSGLACIIHEGSAEGWKKELETE